MPENTVPLVYVFIGDSLPGYVTPSLRLTRRFFRGDMVLLTNARNKPSVGGVVVEDFSSWYRPDSFGGFVEKTPLDQTFRGGFWLVTAERFFVLSQYMATKQVAKLFHAELDNIVFNLEAVADFLDGVGKGVFYPTDTGGAGLGSLVYCNDDGSLDELTSFMARHSHLGNEMSILREFLAAKPSVAHALPSATVLGRKHTGDLSNGIFDAATMGQWLFGIDPANTVYTTYNKAQNHELPNELSDVTFSLASREGLLFGKSKKSGRFRIHNLHVHSKIFSRLARPGVLRSYFLLNRFPFRFPVVVQPGHWSHRLLGILLRRSTRPLLGRLLRSFPGQQVLRFLVASSRVPLSNRQLEMFHSLLPTWSPAGRGTASFATAVIRVTESKGSASISCSVWSGKATSTDQGGVFTNNPDETRMCETPLDALTYVLSLTVDTLVVFEGEVTGIEAIPMPTGGRQVLWPDRKKPQWDPPFEIPIFPHRSRAVTFTTTPQVVSLPRLRKIFAPPGSPARWSKHVRLDTFVAVLVNTHAQHALLEKSVLLRSPSL